MGHHALNEINARGTPNNIFRKSPKNRERGEARMLSRLTIPAFIIYHHVAQVFEDVRPCYRL